MERKTVIFKVLLSSYLIFEKENWCLNTLDVCAAAIGTTWALSCDPAVRSLLPFEARFEGMFPPKQQIYKHCIRSSGGCPAQSKFEHAFLSSSTQGGDAAAAVPTCRTQLDAGRQCTHRCFWSCPANTSQRPCNQSPAIIAQRQKTLREKGCQTGCKLKEISSLRRWSLSSSLGRLHSSHLHHHFFFKGMQCMIPLPCCEMLCQAVKKSTAVTFSPRRGYIPGAGDTISVRFLPPCPAELILKLAFYLWETFGDTWLKHTHRSPFPA